MPTDAIFRKPAYYQPIQRPTLSAPQL